jgi:hypothetical protein
LENLQLDLARFGSINVRKTLEFKSMVELVLILRSARSWLHFLLRGCTAPFPSYLKMQVLKAHSVPKAAWIETGTYEGSTSKFLASRFPMVTTIEPSTTYYHRAKQRLGKIKNVKVIFGTSEQFFQEALESTSECVNIWLDGHFSEGETFLGNAVTPILSELADIAYLLPKFSSVALFIDDVRLFGDKSYSKDGYPQLSILSNWCDRNHFTWQISRDIFIAKYSNLPLN